MRWLFMFLGILSLLVALALLISAPLLHEGLLHPIAHQRLGYVGTPIIVIYLAWSVARGVRAPGAGGSR